VRVVTLSVELEEIDDKKLNALGALIAAEKGECDLELEVASKGRFRASFAFPDRKVAPSIALEEGMLALFGRSDVVTMR
jgi:hypothetical protein